MWRARAAAAFALWAAGAAPLAAQGCPPAPEPVQGLAFGSRYAEGNESRSELDPAAAQAAEDALAPVDDLLREFAREANAALEGDAGAAACAVERMAAWARADALSEMGSDTAALTLGSRRAGSALALLQAAPTAERAGDVAEIEAWLSRRLAEQATFWEAEAPPGAGRGNLRAWAALAAAATTARVEDPALRAWATWSTAYVLCTAAADGSLPQEMSRGRLAFGYQLHALAPLAATTLPLGRQGIDLSGQCGGAIHRVAGFLLDDLATGERTRAITGEAQSLFDGSDILEPFQLAWLEAYLRLPEVPRRAEFGALAARHRPLAVSKLGGAQAILWDGSD